MDSYIKFVKEIKNVRFAKSIRGAVYENFSFGNDEVVFTRRSSGERWQIPFEVLFEIYQKADRINTSRIREICSNKGRYYSPSWAILVAAGFYNRGGEKIMFI